MSNIETGLESVNNRLAEALEKAGRKPDAARLVAVSKTFPAEDVKIAYEAGQRAFGENKVQELDAKAPVLPQDIEWHLIGHLQHNKVRHAVTHAAWIHSIDSLALLQRVLSISKELNVSPNLLLEVNVSGEESKFGMAPDDVARTLEACPTPLCVGLMTIAPLDASESSLHAVFGGLRKLRDKTAESLGIPLPELSMGMSADFPVAVAEGATLIRVGTAIFGHRQYNI